MINGMVVSEFIAGNFFYVFVGWILVTVYLRRFRRTSLRKRVAVLIQAVSIFLVFIAASAVVEFGGTDAYLLATVVAVGIVLATVLRKRAFPYSRTCPACGARSWPCAFSTGASFCPDWRPSGSNRINWTPGEGSSPGRTD